MSFFSKFYVFISGFYIILISFLSIYFFYYGNESINLDVDILTENELKDVEVMTVDELKTLEYQIDLKKRREKLFSPQNMPKNAKEIAASAERQHPKPKLSVIDFDVSLLKTGDKSPDGIYIKIDGEMRPIKTGIGWGVTYNRRLLDIIAVKRIPYTKKKIDILMLFEKENLLRDFLYYKQEEVLNYYYEVNPFWHRTNYAEHIKNHTEKYYTIMNKKYLEGMEKINKRWK